MRKQIIALVAVAGLAPLALAVPASADPGKGAERFSFDECFDEGEPDGPPIRVCFSGQGRENVTQTPSGNFHVNGRGTFTFSITSEEFTGSSTTRGKFNLLLKDGQEQVVHDRGRFTDTFNGITCSGKFAFMIVKGEVKKDRFSVSCDGEFPEPEPEPES